MTLKKIDGKTFHLKNTFGVAKKKQSVLMGFAFKGLEMPNNGLLLIKRQKEACRLITIPI